MLPFGFLAIIGMQILVPGSTGQVAVGGYKAKYLPRALVPQCLVCTVLILPYAGLASGQSEAKSLVHIRQSAFGGLLRADICLDAHHSQWAAVAIPFDYPTTIEYPYPMPVLVPQAKFGFYRVGFAADVLIAAYDGLIAIIRMDKSQPQVLGVWQFAWLVSEHLKPGVGVETFAGAKIPVPHSKPRPLKRSFPDIASDFLAILNHALRCSFFDLADQVRANEAMKR